MSHVKMLYGENYCELGQSDFDWPNYFNSRTEWACENVCNRYEDSSYTSESGIPTISLGCKHCGYREVYAEKTLKRFDAREQPHDGFCVWQEYPYMLETSRRAYPCKYLEIDGRVYCDMR